MKYIQIKIIFKKKTLKLKIPKNLKAKIKHNLKIKKLFPKMLKIKKWKSKMS